MFPFFEVRNSGPHSFHFLRLGIQVLTVLFEKLLTLGYNTLACFYIPPDQCFWQVLNRLYIRDLINKHLNSRLLEVRYSDHPLCRCPVSITFRARNSGLIVRYSDPHLNNWQIVWSSNHHLNNRPFHCWASSDHLNTRLVLYADPHCVFKLISSAKSLWKLRLDQE